MEDSDYKYYAIIAGEYRRSNPLMVIRRKVLNGVAYDEAFTPNLKWEWATQLKDVEWGHSDRAYDEITKEEADAFVKRRTEEVQQHRALLGQVDTSAVLYSRGFCYYSFTNGYDLGDSGGARDDAAEERVRLQS